MNKEEKAKWVDTISDKTKKLLLGEVSAEEFGEMTVDACNAFSNAISGSVPLTLSVAPYIIFALEKVLEATKQQFNDPYVKMTYKLLKNTLSCTTAVIDKTEIERMLGRRGNG